MDNYKHEGILAFGCGCNKGKTVQAAGAAQAARRVTVYSVMVNGAMASEHMSLPEARTAAIAANGRVKVSSKIV